jgi:hypothetical protein
LPKDKANSDEEAERTRTVREHFSSEFNAVLRQMNQFGGPTKKRLPREPLYHHKYMVLGFAVPRQVVPEGVVETFGRPFRRLLLLKGD